MECLEIENKYGRKTTYNTRCIKIGQIKCLFLSFWYGGRSPLLTLGPSWWPYTIILVGLSLLVLIYFVAMVHMASLDKNIVSLTLCFSGILANVALLMLALFKNPGIP